MKYILLMLFLVGCGNEQIECVFKGCPQKSNPTAKQMVTPEQKSNLTAMTAQIKPWLLTCEGGIACGEKTNGTPESGDSMLFGGMLCLAGDQAQCAAVKQSQDQFSGQLFRNPGGTRGSNDSSRDMLLGFLCYLTATKDVAAANLLIEYIKSNDNLLCPNATDNRCNLSTVQHAAVWGTMKRVWTHLGLTPTWEMEQGDIGDDTIIDLQSKFAFEGFPLHLIGVELLLRQETNSFTSVLQKTANTLLARQPNNPFFEMIAKGKTSRSAEITLEKCPKSQPLRRKQWAWQRAETEKAWLESKGHDCIFMERLLTR